jgi:nitrile hydratase
MDSIHDIGGRQGFGKVSSMNQDAFHDFWEKEINAINSCLVGRHVYNMDEYRHAIERMSPRHYMDASYYERVYTAVITLCVEKGIFTAEAINAAAGENVPISYPSKPGRLAISEMPEFAIGDTVQVKTDFFGGHVRMPSYIRGKTGQIFSQSPEYPFPDASAHGLHSACECTYDVCFKSTNLWPGSAEVAEIYVSVFRSYLELP